MNNVEDKGITSFTPTFIVKEYNLPTSKISMTTKWVKNLKFDYIGITKMKVVEGKTYRNKQSGEYETANLHTSYRMVVLMLNRIFDKDDGRTYKFGWIPLIYYLPMKGTIFNCADIVSNRLSTTIVAAQEGLHQRKFEFYMGSFFIDCILSFHPFEKLNCTWNGGKTPIYVAYQILWGHKCHNFYKLICEEFLMPLYRLIFLEECKCLSEGALESIKDFGDYFFSEEEMYLRMYRGAKAPSFLPRYATDYIVHKEAVNQMFLDGFGSHLFDLKKVVFPQIHFYVGSYKFSKVKRTP